MPPISPSRCSLPLAPQGVVCPVTRKEFPEPPGNCRLDMTKGVLLRAGWALSLG